VHGRVEEAGHLGRGPAGGLEWYSLGWRGAGPEGGEPVG
jgi:hypothetical protein